MRAAPRYSSDNLSCIGDLLCIFLDRRRVLRVLKQQSKCRSHLHERELTCTSSTTCRATYPSERFIPVREDDEEGNMPRLLSFQQVVTSRGNQVVETHLIKKNKVLSMSKGALRKRNWRKKDGVRDRERAADNTRTAERNEKESDEERRARLLAKRAAAARVRRRQARETTLPVSNNGTQDTRTQEQCDRHYNVKIKSTNTHSCVQRRS